MGQSVRVRPSESPYGETLARKIFQAVAASFLALSAILETPLWLLCSVSLRKGGQTHGGPTPSCAAVPGQQVWYCSAQVSRGVSPDVCCGTGSLRSRASHLPESLVL